MRRAVRSNAGFIKENGAAGAITFQLDLGRAMLAADGADRVRATVDFLGGELLVEGEVTENTVTYGGGFDLGQMKVRGGKGEAVLGVYNEFMTADFGGKRVATFPDMIGTLDPQTGDVVSISESQAWRPMLRSSWRIARDFRSARARSIPPCFPRSKRRWASICVHIFREKEIRDHVAALRQPSVWKCLEGPHIC